MSTSANCNLLLYADDSAQFTSHKDPKVIPGVLSRILESCRQWLIDNKLSLHLDNTKSILFGSQLKLSKAGKFGMSCDGKMINPTNSVKYLGITLDEDLKGESIAKSIVKNASGRLRFLYRQVHLFNRRSGQTISTAHLFNAILTTVAPHGFLPSLPS